MHIASMNYVQSHYLLASINWKDIWININLDITYNEFT